MRTERVGDVAALKLKLRVCSTAITATRDPKTRRSYVLGTYSRLAISKPHFQIASPVACAPPLPCPPCRNNRRGSLNYFQQASRLSPQAVRRLAGCTLHRGLLLFGVFLCGAPFQRFGHHISHFSHGSRLARPDLKLAGALLDEHLQARYDLQVPGSRHLDELGLGRNVNQIEYVFRVQLFLLQRRLLAVGHPHGSCVDDHVERSLCEIHAL